MFLCEGVQFHVSNYVKGSAKEFEKVFDVTSEFAVGLKGDAEDFD